MVHIVLYGPAIIIIPAIQSAPFFLTYDASLVLLHSYFRTFPYRYVGQFFMRVNKPLIMSLVLMFPYRDAGQFFYGSQRLFAMSPFLDIPIS